MSSDVLDRLAPNSVLNDFDLDLAPIVVSGATTNVRSNEWVETVESIEVFGQRHNFNVRWRLTNPRLSSISFRVTTPRAVEGQESRGPRPDFTGVVMCGRELEVFVNDQWLDVSGLICAAVRKSNGGLDGISDERILLQLKGYGLDLAGEMPMYLQHLGASREKFEEIAARFVALGAHARDQRPGRGEANRVNVQAFYRMENDGLPVAGFEIGYANRAAASVNPNSGFIGMLDATWNTFLVTAQIHKNRSALQRLITEDPDSDAGKQARLAEQAYVNLFSSPRERRPFHNWGGTSVVPNQLDPAVVNYYSQQVPCGRFAVDTDDGPEVWDVWTTRQDRTDGETNSTEGSESSQPSSQFGALFEGEDLA